MKTITTSITTACKPFAVLTTQRYENKSNPLTLSELPKSIKTVVGLIAELFGTKFADDSKLGIITAQQGGFKRLYGPCVCQEDNKVILYMGEQKLEITKALFKEKKVNLGGSEAIVEAKFVQSNLYGMGDELCLSLEIYSEEKDTLIIFNAGLRVKDFKNPPAVEELNALAKRKTAALVEHLDDVPTGGFSDLPTLSMGQLPTDQDYKVVGYRGFMVGDRAAYIMKVEVSPEFTFYPEAHDRETLMPIANAFEDDKEIFTEEESVEYVEVWSNKDIATSLGTNPVITPEKPAELVVQSAKVSKDKKVSVAASLIVTNETVKLSDSDELEFDW